MKVSLSRAKLPFPQKLSALLPKWFTITDDLYATQAGAEVKQDEVMPNKRPKWKIRGDYRGSGARTFDRNSVNLTRGWLTCGQLMKRDLHFLV